MLAEERIERNNLESGSTAPVPDFLDHIDDWIEYLVELMPLTDDRTRTKYERQLRYLVGFRCGANCNIAHNHLLMHYYSKAAEEGEKPSRRRDTVDKAPSTAMPELAPLREDVHSLGLQEAMSVFPNEPVQACYQSDPYAYSQILKALASEDLFFLQGPPGTGKTTAIVEIVLQTLRHKPNARILITSETHVAVDNALDRLTARLSEEQMEGVLRYPQFTVQTLENEMAREAQAHARANKLWTRACQAAPELTDRLWGRLERGRQSDDDNEMLPRWMVRNLADKHRIIGVTCNQIDHLIDDDSEHFDLAIVDECSKATLPEWLMALTMTRKCVLVGDHRQLPPTFCEEESEALSVLGEHKERLIRNGVIERIFEHFPVTMKGTLLKQYRMLPHIGRFISDQFYGGRLEHHRMRGNGLFDEFGWLTYKVRNLKVPAQQGSERKILVNEVEIALIVARLRQMRQRMLAAGDGAPGRLSVAVITPYRAQCRECRSALSGFGLSDCFTIEIDTVDAFQGRQADIVFFSFVRTMGPATFYADDRRLNVAISRARDSVYLVGDLAYIRRKRLPALQALSQLPVLHTHNAK